jgi:hypothetical protein
VIWHVAHATAEFVGAAVDDVKLECRLDRREDGTVQPCPRMPFMVEPGFEMLGGDRVVIIVPDIVLGRTGHLDWGADEAREQCRFRDVIGCRLGAETAAEQRHVGGNVGFVETEDLSDGLAHLRRVLHRRPVLATQCATASGTSICACAN